MRISKPGHRAGLETFEDKTFFQGEAIEAAIRAAIANRGLKRPDAALGVLESVLAEAALAAGDSSLARQAADEGLLDPSAATAAQQILARILD
jgi:hypothetical protein